VTHSDADRPIDPVTEPIGRIDPAARSAEYPPTAQQVPEPGGWLGAVRTHLAFALVLVVVALGIVLIMYQHWRRGAALIGGALELAALFRALLSPRRAGLLVVRGRPVDALSYAGLGAVILFVAGTITGGPFG
jgi:multisubunit Na+/H+ antiporter MnhB subunit